MLKKLLKTTAGQSTSPHLYGSCSRAGSVFWGVLVFNSLTDGEGGIVRGRGKNFLVCEGIQLQGRSVLWPWGSSRAILKRQRKKAGKGSPSFPRVFRPSTAKQIQR